jgi:hypothetical protein
MGEVGIKRPRGRPRKDGLPAGTPGAPRQRRVRAERALAVALEVRPDVTVGEDGKISLKVDSKREAILLLSRAGFGTREIVAALGDASASWVMQVRWEARRAGQLTDDVEKLLKTRAVPMAAEVVSELLEDDTLKPALRYQIAKDALQTKPFASGHQGGASPAGPVAIGIRFEMPPGVAPVVTGQIVGVGRTDEGAGS